MQRFDEKLKDQAARSGVPFPILAHCSFMRYACAIKGTEFLPFGFSYSFLQFWKDKYTLTGVHENEEEFTRETSVNCKY